ncbi:MAG: hypothetical protein AAGG02_09910 [Cyanobacteria bacterium P01_H01_bin.15]
MVNLSFARFQRGFNRVALKPVLSAWSQHNSKYYDINKSIIVCGSGRSGTTWLAEMISALPNYSVLFEPCNVNCNRRCAQFALPSSVPKTGNIAHMHLEYFKEVLSGTYLTADLLLKKQMPRWDYWNNKGFVVKFIQLNWLLPWLISNIPLRALYIVRHPCAVVASQLTHPHWQDVREDEPWRKWGLLANHRQSSINSLLIREPWLLEIANSLNSLEEALGFYWAVQNYQLLNPTENCPWYTVTYEQLVSNGPAEMSRIFEYLQEPLPPGANKVRLTPSATVIDSATTSSNAKLLAGWKEKLTSSQVDSILNIVRRVGINVYSDELHPHVSSLPNQLLSSPS